MRKWFRSFYSSGLFIPFILLLPYMCTIALNGADKALLLHSPGVEDMVPLMLMVQMKGDYAEEAVKAQNAARAIFGGGAHSENMPSTELSDGDFTDGEISVLDLLAKSKLVPSKGEARRLIDQGGISIDDEKVNSVTAKISKSSFEKAKKIKNKNKKLKK